MTCSAPKSSVLHARGTRPQRRPAERKPITKKPRPARKMINPLDILTLVVAGPRGNGKFACPLCSSNFGRRCELKRHVAEVHTMDGACRFACKHPACGKTFTRKDALTKHQAVKHQGKRRFVCSTCSEKFTTRYDLSRHSIRVHSNVKKRFTCEFCSAGFSQKSQLTMHKGRVHNPRNADNESSSSSRRTSMDSLAAAAMAVAAEEQAIERERAAGEHDERRVAEQCPAREPKCRAEALGAEALLEAAGYFCDAENGPRNPSIGETGAGG